MLDQNCKMNWMRCLDRMGCFDKMGVLSNPLKLEHVGVPKGSTTMQLSTYFIQEYWEYAKVTKNIKAFLPILHRTDAKQTHKDCPNITNESKKNQSGNDTG